MIPIVATGAAPPFFAEIATLIVASAAIAYLCHRIGIMPIVGFLVAGVVIGPNGLGLVSDQALVDAAAEVGVILLLFTIGIEFSLEKLARIQRLIFGGGGLQVGVTILLTMAVLLSLNVSWQAALFTGFLVSLSSTAIVLKLLGDKNEMNSDHGQVGLGLLIFQDLAIIVMVMLVPMLAGDGGSALDVVWALAKAAIIIVLVLVVARRIMPPILEAVARTCAPELFLLAVIAICFGTAFLTSLAGVSLSLGAFLAGLIVSESRFSEHAMSEITPLQIIFSATFFVSVGMLLDVGFFLDNVLLIIGVIALVLVIKVVATGIGAKALGYPMPVVAASSLMLAQIGEFSFVLERAGREVDLFPGGIGETGSQLFISAAVLVMIGTPALTMLGNRIAETMRVRDRNNSIDDSDEVGDGSLDGDHEHHAGFGLSDHVIVAGYGIAARQLARGLKAMDVPFVITTLSPQGANEAERDGYLTMRGDSGRQRTLLQAGIKEARTLALVDDNPGRVAQVVSVARTIRSDIHIVARTRYRSEISVLRDHGVDCVIAEELESIVQLLAQVLQDYQVPASVISEYAEEIRGHEYAALFSDARPNANTVEKKAVKNDIDVETTVSFDPSNSQGTCSHLDQIQSVFPSAVGCEECLADGESWVHLRICMTCGHVGCCDASKNKHATQHFDATRHPIARSIEPAETWAWCYEDKVLLKGRNQ